MAATALAPPQTTLSEREPAIAHAYRLWLARYSFRASMCLAMIGKRFYGL
jgi:hypothetical protein